jgi:hypothetical protein
VLEAVKGRGYRGDIAIDDVKYTSGQRCPQSMYIGVRCFEINYSIRFKNE